MEIRKKADLIVDKIFAGITKKDCFLLEEGLREYKNLNYTILDNRTIQLVDINKIVSRKIIDRLRD